MMKLYRDMDSAELDAQYNARATVPESLFLSIMQEYAEQSRRARETLSCTPDLAYGSHPDETLDVFRPGPSASAPRAPVFVYIHGGYWRALSKNESSSMAPAYTSAGAVYVAVNYALAPAVTLDTIVDQCRRAVAWVYRNIEQYGGDPDRIYIGGSSAGGHLCGMLLASGWHTPLGMPLNAVKGALLLSGLYDLAPIPHTHINAWMKLSAEDAARNSPVNYEPAAGCPIVVSYGDNETDEFKRQSRDYLQQWQARGYPGDYVRVPGLNHFDLVLECGKPDSPLARAMLEMMGLTRD
ncbi:alpha/beta hydrolase [Bordetella sp. 02P26C-1]|uniref:alpha/beta hydrolase n=1 Tax=Bordetella sp. 02P26C-1 TaxID=2683195 RepID=UPI0013523A99|nr:alpha/beta hydrolase [Bordetella sp. 02P26C-1]MVW80891.1 alpha/beta hydrolase fold domain-containing protein [Bordetella sp. 02P26C-1]